MTFNIDLFKSYCFFPHFIFFKEIIYLSMLNINLAFNYQSYFFVCLLACLLASFAFVFAFAFA